MVAYLHDRGWPDVHAIALQPSNGNVGLDQLALQVQAHIDNHMADAAKVDLVGFSMGGIVSRYYVQRLGGARRVSHFITLSAPHNGTWTGYLRWNAGAGQMRPDSPFLKDLNSSLQDLAQVEFTSLWTPYDLMILPAHSSKLPLGRVLQLPILAHPLMVTDERVLAAIAAVLDGVI